MTCPYNKCDGSGLIPFKKEGRVIPHTFQYCECSEYSNPTDHYRELRPEDIDYPVSYSHYRALCREHGWKDPGTDIPEELEERKVVVVYEHTQVTDKAIRDIEEMKRTIKNIRPYKKRPAQPPKGKRTYTL